MASGASSTRGSRDLTGSPEGLRAAFFALTTPREVAALLDVSYSALTYHLHRIPEDARYATYSVPKRRGGERTINAPITALKFIQRKLNQVLQALLELKQPVHGFARGRGIVTNASSHVGRSQVLNLDLQDFFPTINFGRVRGVFRAKPYERNAEVATVLAQICCHRNQLPQGAPSSPVVSNMVCARLDGQLQRLARSCHATYTRYADDITFSTTASKLSGRLCQKAEDGSVTVGPDLQAVIAANGFSVNPDKVRLAGAAERQRVTGLTVNEFPNVDRRLVRQIRAMLHAWRRHGLERAEEEYRTRYARGHRAAERPLPLYQRVVKGKLDYLSMVRGTGNPCFRRLLAQYAALVPSFKYPFAAEAPKVEPFVPTNLPRMLRRAVWVLEQEDGDDIRQGTAVALRGVGIVTCDHVVGAKTIAYRPEEPNVQYEVTIRHRDPVLDLALIEIAGCAPSAAEALVVSDAEPQFHDAIFVAGCPNHRLGDPIRVTSGHVSGFRRSPRRRLWLDAAIVRGTSGGAVLNASGEVVGIAVTGADSDAASRDTEDHCAIPIASLRTFLAKC